MYFFANLFSLMVRQQQQVVLGLLWLVEGGYKKVHIETTWGCVAYRLRYDCFEYICIGRRYMTDYYLCDSTPGWCWILLVGKYRRSQHYPLLGIDLVRCAIECRDVHIAKNTVRSILEIRANFPSSKMIYYLSLEEGVLRYAGSSSRSVGGVRYYSL